MGYTQAQLSELTGINRSMIGRIENCEYMPTIEQIESLGNTLGFDYNDLFIEDIRENKEQKLHKKYNIAVAGTGYVSLSIATLLA